MNSLEYISTETVPGTYKEQYKCISYIVKNIPDNKHYIGSIEIKNVVICTVINHIEVFIGGNKISTLHTLKLPINILPIPKYHEVEIRLYGSQEFIKGYSQDRYGHLEYNLYKSEEFDTTNNALEIPCNTQILKTVGGMTSLIPLKYSTILF